MSGEKEPSLEADMEEDRGQRRRSQQSFNYLLYVVQLNKLYVFLKFMQQFKDSVYVGNL